MIRASSPEELGRNIVVQGGTFYNEAVLRAFEKEMGVNVIRPDIAGLMGAYGAALYGKARAGENARSTVLTEEELRTIVDVSKESGVIESEEHTMINNVFDFGDAQAKEVMIPRIDMTFAQVDSSYDELIQIFQEDKFTRLPVYEDTTDNVIGILNMKDLLLCHDKDHFSVRDIMREPYFTYEHKNTAELFMEMRKSSISLAIVLDEYGATAGLITLEDLLEEIVGEIHDEYDENEEENIKAVGKHEYIIEGSTNLDDLNDSLDLNLESEDYDSLGGFIIEKLDRLPKAGDSVSTEEGIRMVVEKLDKNRIETVHLYLPENYREHTSDSLETDD